MNTYLGVKGTDGKVLRDVTDSSGLPVSLTGSNLQEQKTQANAVAGVLTFSAPINTVEIYNTDAVNTGVFTVNGINITVPPGKVFKSTIGGVASAFVTVTGATTYIVSRYT